MISEETKQCAASPHLSAGKPSEGADAGVEAGTPSATLEASGSVVGKEQSNRVECALEVSIQRHHHPRQAEPVVVGLRAELQRLDHDLQRQACGWCMVAHRLFAFSNVFGCPAF